VPATGWCINYEKQPFDKLFKKVTGHDASDFMKGFKK